MDMNVLFMMINVIFKNFFWSILYILILILFNSNGVSSNNKANKNIIYPKQINRLNCKNYVCNFNDNFSTFRSISYNNSDNKQNINNYNVIKKLNKYKKLYEHIINNSRNKISDTFYHSYSKYNGKIYNNKFNSNSNKYTKYVKKRNFLFIKYFNLKYLDKRIVISYKKREIYFFKNYKKNYSKNFCIEKENSPGLRSVADPIENCSCILKDDASYANDNFKLKYEEKRIDQETDINKYIDKINTFINIEKYKELYGNEIYNSIVKLYIEKNIPENYEEIYFSEKVEKSIVFNIDNYNDIEFEKLLEEEFRNNGVFINNIDKKYYSKDNIIRMKKILYYLPLLKLINNPSDLKKLKKKYLPLLSHELKVFLYLIINITGGHFSSSLGLLELQLLLLYIFNQPYDHAVYDIGHNAYIHKILTGRKFLFFSIRKKRGICGYLNIFESIYDKFGAGHSSTSLSAIQGIYESDWQVKDKEKNKSVMGMDNNTIRNISHKEESHNNDNGFNLSDRLNELNLERKNSNDLDKIYITIIGDGGMTGGMALEALNYISFLNSKVLIIYNDNREISLPTNTLSISGTRPIGSFADHLHNFIENRKSSKNNDSASVKEKNVFENLNYNYIGPINGNNINELYDVLIDIRKNKIKKATVLHICTKKTSKFIDIMSPISKMHFLKKNQLFPIDLITLFGDSEKNNSITCNNNRKENEATYTSNSELCAKETGEVSNEINGKIKKQENIEYTDIEYEKMFDKKTITDIYTEEMLKYLKDDKNIIFISPAMLDGSGLIKVGQIYPKNVYDVGIAEQHAVTFSAAMAMNKNLKVYLCIYSTFLQRGYDQVIHDLNLQNIPLKVIIGRSGLVGEDGATHQGIYDLSLLGLLKNGYIISPSNTIDLKKALKFSYLDKEHTMFIRLPRMNALNNCYMKKFLNIDIQKEEQDNDINNFIGKARIIKMSDHNNNNKKKKVSIFNMGSMLFNVVNALKEIEKDKYFSESFSFSIIDMIFLNPLDKHVIDYIVKENKHQYLITYEDNTVGGFSSHFNNYLIENNFILKYNLLVDNVYLPNYPIEHASHKEQQEAVKMDKYNLAHRIKNFLKNN